MSNTYHPEKYWSEIAQRTSARSDGIIAGDDDPFYHYKRAEFLKLLNKINFKDRKVLEIGSGPGGNLKEILTHNPSKLCGADISQNMINYARSQLPESVQLYKVNGTELPFDNQSFDISLTVTVLQHNTDEQMLKTLMKSICSCTSQEIHLFERIEPKIRGDELNMGRPITYYNSIMNNEGFVLKEVTFLNVTASYYVAGIARKLLNSPKRKEAEPLSPISLLVQKLLLPISKKIDPFIKSDREFAQLHYVRQ